MPRATDSSLLVWISLETCRSRQSFHHFVASLLVYVEKLHATNKRNCTTASASTLFGELKIERFQTIKENPPLPSRIDFFSHLRRCEHCFRRVNQYPLLVTLSIIRDNIEEKFTMTINFHIFISNSNFLPGNMLDIESPLIKRQYVFQTRKTRLHIIHMSNASLIMD